MSAFICNNKTISVIARAFIEYGVTFEDGKYHEPEYIIMMDKKCKEIGQSLLEANYRSVNYRYNENTETPEFEYEEVEFDEGVVYGCMLCFDYQACEVEDWYDSAIYHSLLRLRRQITERLFRKLNMKVPYGYDGFDILEG